MKVSDLVTSSGQRYEATQNLLRTEETGAVNSGLVRSAERDALPAGRRAASSGMSNATLAAAAKSRSDGATGHGRGDAVRVTNASDSKLTTAPSRGQAKPPRRARRAPSKSSPAPSPQPQEHHLQRCGRNRAWRERRDHLRRDGRLSWVTQTVPQGTRKRASAPPWMTPPSARALENTELGRG